MEVPKGKELYFSEGNILGEFNCVLPILRYNFLCVYAFIVFAFVLMFSCLLKNIFIEHDGTWDCLWCT